MQHIETIELGSSQSSITFSSIPQSYDDLVILFQGRSDRASDGERNLMQLNSESSNSIELIGNGSSASSNSQTDGQIGILTSASATSNTFNSSTIYISNYTSTSNKSVSSDSVNENNATTAFQRLVAFLSTSSAATTSITFTTQLGNNYVAGTTVSLYGVTAGGDGTVTTS